MPSLPTLTATLHPEKLHSIPGWLSQRDAETLFRYAAQTPVPHVVELGSFCGKSTVVLAAAIAARGGSVVACDTWPDNYHYHSDKAGAGAMTIHSTWQEFWASLAACNVTEYVTALREDHHHIIRTLRGRFGLVFIDGDHTFAAVEEQARWAWEMLVPGGCILFDDYIPAWPEVVRAVDAAVAAWGMPLTEVDGKVAVVVKPFSWPTVSPVP